MATIDREAQRIQLRSEEIQEILGKEPKWISKWGTTTILAVFVLLLGLSFVVKYPDKIEGNFSLKSPTTPIDIKASMDVQISDVIVKSNQKVKKGDPLLILQSNAKYSDILLLKQNLAEWSSMSIEDLLLVKPSKSLQLGSLNNSYTELIANFGKLKTLKTNNYNNFRINSIGTQKKKIEADIAKLGTEIATVNQEHKMLQNRFQTYRANYSIDKTISKPQMVEAQEQSSAALDKLLALKDKQAKLRSRSSSLASKSSGIQIETGDIRKLTLDDLKYSSNMMLDDIKAWEDNYILKSPNNGRILFYPNIKLTQQYFKANDKILALRPSKTKRKTSKNDAHILISKEDYEKIDLDQDILVSLDSHPASRYGKIQGKVKAKTDLLEDDMYIVSAQFPAPIKSTKGNIITIQNDMTGTAEIITSSRSLFSRFFNDIF